MNSEISQDSYFINLNNAELNFDSVYTGAQTMAVVDNELMPIDSVSAYSTYESEDALNNDYKSIMLQSMPVAYDEPISEAEANTQNANKTNQTTPNDTYNTGNQYAYTMTLGAKSSREVTFNSPFGNLENCMSMISNIGLVQGSGHYQDQCYGIAAVYGSLIEGCSTIINNEGQFNTKDTQFNKYDNDNVYKYAIKDGILTGDAKYTTKENGKTVEKTYNLNQRQDISNFQQQTCATKDQFVSAIKEQLNQGKPVMVRVSSMDHNDNESRHYALAVGQTNNGEIILLDPVGGTLRVLDTTMTFNDWKSNANGADTQKMGGRIPYYYNNYEYFTWKGNHNTQEQRNV